MAFLNFDEDPDEKRRSVALSIHGKDMEGRDTTVHSISYELAGLIKQDLPSGNSSHLKIDYRLAPVTRYAFWDIYSLAVENNEINESRLREAFADKIVFLGYTFSAEDEHTIPVRLSFASGQQPGLGSNPRRLHPCAGGEDAPCWPTAKGRSTRDYLDGGCGTGPRVGNIVSDALSAEGGSCPRFAGAVCMPWNLRSFFVFLGDTGRSIGFRTVYSRRNYGNLPLRRTISAVPPRSKAFQELCQSPCPAANP